MNKSQRLNDMMIYLNKKNYFNLQDLMTRYQISKSTALRDVQALESIGMPIYVEYGRNGRYGLLQNRLFAPILFSLDELYAMYFSMLTLKAYQSTPFHLSAEQLQEKFETCLPQTTLNTLNEMGKILKFEGIKHHNSSPFLQQILISALETSVCQIQYNKRGQIRTYYIQFDEINTRFGQWYVVGYNFETQEHQVFRCDKVLDLKPSKAYEPISFDLLKTKKEQGFYQEDALPFVVEISHRAVDLFHKESYHNMTLVKDNDRYYIKGHFHSHESQFMVNYLLNYGCHILSLEPKSLREAMIIENQKRLTHMTSLS